MSGSRSKVSQLSKVVILILLVIPGFVFAQVPSTISYQGVLTDNTGNLVADGSYNMQFSLFASKSGGTSLWSETQTVSVTKGVFDIRLGAINPLNLNFDAPYWLEITVKGSTLTPRIELSSSAYSLNSSRIQGKPVSTSTPSSGQVLKWNGSEWAPANESSGSVSGAAGGDLLGSYPNPTVAKIQGMSVSSNSPSTGQVLKWNGSQWTPGNDNTGGLTLPFSSTISTTNNAFSVTKNGSASLEDGAIFGESTSNSGVDDGVIGITSSYGGIGVVGVNKSTSSGSGIVTPYGVFGSSDSPEGVGVYGWAKSTSGTADFRYGVYGKAESGTGIGVFGVATSTSGLTYGVEALSESSSGTGIYAYAPSGGYAGWFNGDVHVNGTLSKSGGSFEIDDPLDPANKILRHSFVESPDMMNIYNGNVTTDASGVAVVQLPDYFDALNMSFRYQLTVIGQFAQAIVSKEIQNNQFTIKTDKPNIKVSWQVTGIRKDPWAEKHRIVVEQEKSEKNRGYYLNPRAYGLPDTRSVLYSSHPNLMKQVKMQSGTNIQ